jgi:hypothetical protein
MQTLTEINLQDLISSFGWQNSPAGAALLRLLFRPVAQKFARQMLAFDALTAQEGLTRASLQTLPAFITSLRVYGRENIPAQGAALFLSNHPGMTDTLCLFAAIQRPDLHILAASRPFLQALTHTSRQLIYLQEDPAQRLGALRQTAAALKRGQAVLTFPAGQIEPDAAVYPGAAESLQNWSASTDLFLRLAPQTQVIPVFVRGVLWRQAVLHPLTRLKTNPTEREKLGAALQLLAHLALNLSPVDVSIQFGQALPPRAQLTERMKDLIQHPPQGEGLRLL